MVDTDRLCLATMIALCLATYFYSHVYVTIILKLQLPYLIFILLELIISNANAPFAYFICRIIELQRGEISHLFELL